MKRSFATRIYSKKSFKRVYNKIKLLGKNEQIDADKFLNNRLILCFIIFILIMTFSKSGFILAPALTITFYISYEYFILDYRIKKRKIKLESEAIYFFEVLALTLENQNNLKLSIKQTTKSIDNEMSREFKEVLKEMDMGKSMTEALNSMKKRIPSEAINNTILNITQSTKFGGSIVNSLYNQIDFLREKQLQRIKTEIVKLPVKVSAISVLFFVPIMLLLILGPVVLKYLIG